LKREAISESSDSGHWGVSTLPKKRTLVERIEMSALCQKRTLRGRSKKALFDHLVGAPEAKPAHPRSSAFAVLRRGIPVETRYALDELTCGGLIWSRLVPRARPVPKYAVWE